MQRIAEREGAHPLFELEKGRLTEDRFLADLAVELETELGHRPELHRFREIYFEALDPNDEMVELMRGLRERGYRMALLTNNVREWEPLWRSLLPVDEIFELIVDSAYVGMRKPERGIYELTLEKLGLPGEACAFIDDLEINCDAACEHGIKPIRFESTEQVIRDLDALLNGGRPA